MEKLQIQKFGITKDGSKPYLYKMKNDAGMEVQVSDFGATLVNVTVLDQDKNPVEVVLGYEDAAGYENGTAAIGAIVGRNANRIGGACVTINGIDYKLAENDGKNNLHSGPDVYQKRMWRVVENGDDHVTFLLHSPDGDQGYPGALDMKVTYTLDEENGLTIHYEAVPDQDTVINMTNHSYFNLNGHKSGSVLHHRMQLLSDAFTPADAQSIPTGEVCSVDGTPMDFRSTKELGAEIDAAYEPLILGNGYDHNWVLKNEGRFDKVAEMKAVSSWKYGQTVREFRFIQPISWKMKQEGMGQSIRSGMQCAWRHRIIRMRSIRKIFLKQSAKKGKLTIQRPLIVSILNRKRKDWHIYGKINLHSGKTKCCKRVCKSFEIKCKEPGRIHGVGECDCYVVCRTSCDNELS